jgi:EAL domain-containing protein (putative c-di-GMP-specific phosphodiesterase class I)
VRSCARPLALEVTEHVPIEDYSELRRALLECGPAHVAVDDAGAGYASLRHILELQPDVVKLDIGLVRNIDSDPARQALVAGLVHYAQTAGLRLIGEGVETEAERDTLRALGVPLGQGYLFGRPAPLD